MNSKDTSQKSLTFSYSLLQAFYWMNYACIIGYASVYLLSAGFTNTQIGVLMAVSGAVCTVLQPVIAGYADRPDSLSIKKLTFLSSILMAAITVLLLVFSGRSKAVTMTAYGGVLMLVQLLTPFIYSMGIESMNQGKKLNYGISKAMGSLSYAVTVYALGIIVAGAGERSVPVCIMLFIVVFSLYLTRFPFEKTVLTGASGEQAGSAGLLYFYKKYKIFCFSLIGCIFIFISHALLNTFAFQIITIKGGGSQEMGTAMSIAAFCELPTLFCFAYLIRKFRASTLFWISGVFFALKAVGSLLAPDIPSYFAVQVTQMGAWALNCVSAVYYVNSIMDQQDAIKGQAYVTTAYTAASVFSSLCGGTLIDAAGVNSMLLFSAVSALIGMAIIFLSVQAGERQRKSYIPASDAV